MEVEATRKRSYPFDEQMLDLEVTEVRMPTKDRFHLAKLIWEIHDFEEQVEFNATNHSHEIKSEIFTVSIPDRYTKSKTKIAKFYLSMDLNTSSSLTDDDETRDYFGLFLHFEPDKDIENGNDKVTVKYNFEIANVDIEQTKSRKGKTITEYFSYKGDHNCGYSKFVRKQLIVKNPQVLIGGILSITCHLKILCNQSQPMLLPQFICPPNLTCSEQIRLNKGEADVNIICAAKLPNNNKKAKTDSTSNDPAVIIKVHKLVLTSRSKVFAAMFKHDMIEKQTNTITISDFSADTMENFVSFLYDDNCSLLKSGNASVEKIWDLLKAADKYDIQSMKMMCEQSLSKKIRSANVSYMLQMSEELDAKNLRSYIIRYMVLNFEKISQCRWWKDAPRDVIDGVLNAVYKK